MARIGGAELHATLQDAEEALAMAEELREWVHGHLPESVIIAARHNGAEDDEDMR